MREEAEDELEFVHALFTGLFVGLVLFLVFPSPYGKVLAAVVFFVTGAGLHVSWHHRLAFLATLAAAAARLPDLPSRHTAPGI